MKPMRLCSAGEMRRVMSDTYGTYWLEGDPFETWTPRFDVVSLAGARFLAPCHPMKIMAVGLNYYSQAKEVDAVVSEEPLLFLKPPSSIVAQAGKVVYPANQYPRVDYEGELAIVLWKSGREVGACQASKHVLGYS